MEYGGEIVTGGETGIPDTVILVTSDELIASPIAGKEDVSTMDFTIQLDDIVELECGGYFGDEVTIKTASDSYQIPSEGIDSVKFTCAVVENSPLTNTCERLGFGLCRLSICKWATCAGCALVLVGIAFSITMIGIVLGLPFIGAGIALILFSALYKYLGDCMNDNTWTRQEQEANPA